MATCPQCEVPAPDGADFCPNCGGVLSGSGGPRRGADAHELVGRMLFGEYRVARELGRGSAGTVYLAEHDAIDQQIAVKVLHSDSDDSENVRRFRREAKAITRLSHPNIVRALLFGRSREGLLLMAMEHVEGRELRSEVGLTPLDESRALKVAKQLCSAVSEAHDFGIIHRDLKPENVLLTDFRGESDFVKILDFGIAKLKAPEDRDQTALTEAGTVHGTAEFMAPEQARSEQLDGRADIYSVGCILYEMVTGRLPIEAETGAELLRAKCRRAPVPPSEYTDLSDDLEDVILRAVARDRGDRYDDALEMYDAIVARERRLHDDGDTDPEVSYVPGRELTGFHRVPDAPSTDDDPPDRLSRGPASPHPLLVLLVLALAAGTVALAGFVGYLIGRPA